jgi:catechol 2,3-dioxygenase-like lactoylglutathione lyase family enzyme
MIFDHMGIGASNLAECKQFYCKALAPLGIGVVMEVPGAVGLGKNHKPSFWLGANEGLQIPLHIAFAAENRKQVNEFYSAAIAAGGKDNGPPGIRPHYHPNYYAAFVIGPDGHNIEAVCHKPEA